MKVVLAALMLALSSGAVGAGAQDDFDLGRSYRGRDAVKAYRYIRSAARQQHPAAMFTLSNMLVAGEGAARSHAAARYWLEAAAALDNPEALQQLAMHLREGSLGFARDEVRSEQLLRQLDHALKHRSLH